LARLRTPAALFGWYAVVKRWKEVANETEVGFQARDIDDFKPAFLSH